jgi:hypothetical protein
MVPGLVPGPAVPGPDAWLHLILDGVPRLT